MKDFIIIPIIFSGLMITCVFFFSFVLYLERQNEIEEKQKKTRQSLGTGESKSVLRNG